MVKVPSEFWPYAPVTLVVTYCPPLPPVTLPPVTLQLPSKLIAPERYFPPPLTSMPYQPKRLAPPEHAMGAAEALKSAPPINSISATNDARMTLLFKGSLLHLISRGLLFSSWGKFGEGLTSSLKALINSYQIRCSRVKSTSV